VTTMNAINKWNVTGSTKDKQLVLVSYLFELVYDLMIAPGNNVFFDLSHRVTFSQCVRYETIRDCLTRNGLENWSKSQGKRISRC